MDIEYIESSGWFEREFIVKGSHQDILSIKSSLENWIEKLDKN